MGHSPESNRPLVMNMCEIKLPDRSAGTEPYRKVARCYSTMISTFSMYHFTECVSSYFFC